MLHHANVNVVLMVLSVLFSHVESLYECDLIIAPDYEMRTACLLNIRCPSAEEKRGERGWDMTGSSVSLRAVWCWRIKWCRPNV